MIPKKFHLNQGLADDVEELAEERDLPEAEIARTALRFYIRGENQA